MLVFERKTREQIVIGGKITVSVLDIRRGHVRFGIEAPRAIPVRRGPVRAEIDVPGTVPMRRPQTNGRPPRPAA